MGKPVKPSDFFDEDYPVHFNTGGWYALCGSPWLQATGQPDQVTCEKCIRVLEIERMIFASIRQSVRSGDCYIDVRLELGTIHTYQAQADFLMDNLQGRDLVPLMRLVGFIGGKAIIEIRPI